MMELSELKLIAQGGQAEIYELNEKNVLRVLRNANDEENLKIEMSVMKALKDRGKSVPTVYEYLKVEERPSLIIEKLNGYTMLDEIRKKPLQLLKQAERLAALHIEVADSADGIDMISINDRAAHLIPKASLLSDELKEFVLDILAELPKGNDICHGDFHPGNIIIDKGHYYVIDWFGATSGSKLSDIAHTYLILRNTPKIPALSKFQNFMIGCSGSIISRRYISTCSRLTTLDFSEFSKWLIIRAAERVFYGHPLEKDELIKFIKKCKNAKDLGIEPSTWWKFI